VAKQKIDLFYRIDALFNKKPLELTETSSDGFIILRFLATDPRFTELCEELSTKLGSAGTLRVCKLLQTVLPYAQGFRPKYYFKTTKVADPIIIELLADRLICNKEQALVYYDILSNQGLDLYKYFGLNDNIKAVKKKEVKVKKEPEKPERKSKLFC
jgi:hypothetical protein